MKRIFLLLTLFVSTGLFAQNDSTEAAYNITSPYHSVYNFLYYLQPDSYEPKKSLQSFKIEGISDKQAEDYAVKLKQTLDGKGIYIYVDEIPKTTNYRDTVTNKARYILTDLYPDIYLENYGGEWKFSKRSLNAINTAHDEMFPFGTGVLLDLLPKLGTKKFLGLHFWQHIGLLIMIMVSFVLHRAFTFVFEKVILQYLKKKKQGKMADNYVTPVAKPLSVTLVIGYLVIFTPVLQLPVDFSRWVILLLRALYPLFITIVLYRFVNLISFYFEKLADKTESTLDDQLVPLIRKTIRTFIVIIGIFWVLVNLNVDILPLLTGLSIGGLAFALAAQDTIKNFFGSLMIFVDKPFQIGDWITSGDIDGTVEEVGFRSTRVRTFRNSVVYVPNGKLADSTIDNHGLRQYRRFFTYLSLTYDTPTYLIQSFVDGLKKIVENHPETRKDYFEIHMNEFANSSLNVLFYIFFQVPTWSDELRARHEVILQVIDLADELGVNFAFPTQTLHVENLPGKDSLSPTYSTKEELSKKLDEYFKTAGNNNY